MINLTKYKQRLYMYCIVILAVLISNARPAQAQQSCEDFRDMGQGYSTTIASVTDHGDNSFTIVLIVENDGNPAAKKLNHYAVEADPGTYSGVSVQLLSGAFTFANIDLGPNLGAGIPFQGFRINNANGMGNGQAASFSITYTLTGGLQDQQVLAKAGSDNLYSGFTASDFQAVLDCQNQSIFPYYNPPENGKVFDLIGAELTFLYYAYLQNGTYASDDIFQVVGSSVMIDLTTQPGQYAAALSLLTGPSYGLSSTVGEPSENHIAGLFPILNLLSLNALPNLLVSARPIYPGLPQAGIITTQGDTSLRAYFARNGFGVTGEGIRIGVLSDSYNTIIGNPAGDDVLRGDLPGTGNPEYSIPVQVLKDYPYGQRTDEGRAMLQIVHDIAPGAELAFRTGFLGAADFAKGIKELQQAGCDIIVDDITYISEPFFRDGIVAQAVDYVTSQGVTYFSAAGNFGTKSWQSTFYPVAAPAGITGQAHNFAGASGGNDIYQSISLGDGSYTVVLQWDDGTPGTTSSSDFDIYLTNNNGATLFGFNRVNTGGAAIEVLPFTVTDTAQTNIMIVRASGTGAAVLKYIVFRGTFTINEYGSLDASTLVGQANAQGAIAVGAVLYSNTPEFGVDPPTIASFSSRGGTPVNGTARYKPEITAPNGVNTTVDLGGVNIDGDEFPNFFGTSASAPHAAAVAALIQEAREKFYGSLLPPGLLKGIMQNTALDMGPAGYDPESGAGFIQADAALLTLANPKPYITGIYWDTTLVPGIDSIYLTILGQYLNGGSQVLFNGSPLPGGSSLLGDTAITAVIPPFDELYPELQVYNPPMEGTNGLDGGLSNPLYFNTKETILVQIDNKEKKYGEIMPEFTAVYSRVNTDGSVPLESAGLSQSEVDRIHGVALVTIATTLSNTGLWEIQADPGDPLNPNSGVTAADSLDISLLQRYNFVFRRGLLDIQKLDLIIIPKDTAFVYNDSIVDLQFNYVFNNDTLNDIEFAAGDSLAILNTLEASYSSTLIRGTALVNGTELLNAQGEPLLDATALVNKSMMISSAMVAVRGTALVNGELIDAQALYNATALVNAAVLVRGTALVNANALVRGTALVNELDTSGNIVATNALVRGTALVNATALVNTSTVNDTSNQGSIVILGEDDIRILSGDSTGSVELRGVNMVTGNTVGEHLIVPGTFLSNNFNIRYGLGSLTIEPDTAEVIIDPASLAQVYTGTGRPVTVSTVPEGLDVIVTYNGSTTPPVNAGAYSVVAFVNDENYVGGASAALVVAQAPATVTADLKYIYAGQPLPTFTATFSGFLNGDNQSVVTSLTFSLSPSYSGAAGVYQIIPSASALNYLFTPINGTLYVNPYGAGTKQIKPRLDCVDQLTTPVNGFYYIAHFSYSNDNPTAVYIPKGSENYFSGQASYDGANQPEVFLPGGGSFTVPFDGQKLIWTVISYRNNGQKAAVASQASSTSSRCNKSAEAEAPGTGDEATGIKVYPNPTTGTFFIQLDGQVLQLKDISIFDMYGKKLDIDVTESFSDRLEFNLGNEKAGIYIIRINIGESVEVFRVVKT